MWPWPKGLGLFGLSHSLAYKKFQDFSRTFQHPGNLFLVLCHSPAMLNYRQTAVTYSVYTLWQYNPSQNVHHKLQRNCSVSTQHEYFIHLCTHGVLYMKGKSVKLNHRWIPGLSRTSKFNLMTFQVLEILGEKNQELSWRRGNPGNQFIFVPNWS